MKDGDFTKSERDIREAIFAVLDEKDWELYPDEPEDLERWKFVDRVTDRLRELQRAEK